MNDLTALLAQLRPLSGYSTTVTLIVGGLLVWWKVLPSLIDAMANRQSKIEERMGVLLDSATARFEAQIKAADDRHAECMAGQDRQREQILLLEKRIDDQQSTIANQRDLMEGIKRQFKAMQGVAIRLGTMEPSPMIDAMMERLENIPEKKA